MSEPSPPHQLQGSLQLARRCRGSSHGLLNGCCWSAVESLSPGSLRSLAVIICVDHHGCWCCAPAGALTAPSCPRVPAAAQDKGCLYSQQHRAQRVTHRSQNIPLAFPHPVPLEPLCCPFWVFWTTLSSLEHRNGDLPGFSGPLEKGEHST